MCRTILILGIGFFLSSCFVNMRTSSSADSDVSSINIKKPSNLSEKYSDGGYTVCIERINHNQNTCSKSKKISGRWKENEAIQYDLQNNCSSGYKIKMWLWKSQKEETDSKSVYVLNTGFKKNKYEKGYVIIDSNKLVGKKIDLELNFIRLDDGFSYEEEVPNEVDVELNPIFEEEESNDGKGSSSSSGSSIKADLTCNIGNDTFTPSNGGDSKGSKGGSGGDTTPPSGSGNAPNGVFTEIKSLDEVKAGYPSLVVYSNVVTCGPCAQEHAMIKSNQEKFKGKMNIYSVPLEKNNFSGNTLPCGGGIPQNQIFDKDKKQVSCEAGFGSNTQSYIQKLGISL